MKEFYKSPQIEVLAIELEDVILQASGTEAETSSHNLDFGMESAW